MPNAPCWQQDQESEPCKCAGVVVVIQSLNAALKLEKHNGGSTHHLVDVVEASAAAVVEVLAQFVGSPIIITSS